MNRYTLEGIVSDAAHGKRVAYIGRRAGKWLGSIRAEARDVYPDRVESVVRSNGRESVKFVGGGSIHLFASEAGIRGIAADVVILDPDASRDDGTVESAQAAVRACVAGEVIRAD